MRQYAHASSKSSNNIAVAEACIIGLAAALGAVALKWGVGFIGSIRVHLGGQWCGYLPLIGLAGGLFAGGLIQVLSPGSAGSGIPQTKAALAGHPVRLDLTTAFVKLIGCISSLGAGLALGREGPTVQISAALASTFSGWLKTSPTHRIQLIAAGAGAGLAAAFNAPLAGVLFVLEELIKKMSGMAVGTTVVACFVAAVTSRLVGVHSLDINISELFSKASFRFLDIPFLILLGFVSGVSASFFNKTLLRTMTLTRDRVTLPAPITCGFAGLASGLIIMNLPELYWNYAGLRIMLIQDETTNSVILLALVLQLVLTLLAYGLGAPGGLFAPSLTIGACLGHLVAVFELQLTRAGDISTMSVVGMGAFFCAVARVPMTAVVIVFEMTQDFNVVLPLMVSCVVAYLVAEKLDPGSIYDRLMTWSGFSLEEETESGQLRKLKARSFMKREVTSIPSSADLGSVVSTFESVGHNGYPVIDSNHAVVGIITQPDLKHAKTNGVEATTSVTKIMTQNPISVSSDEPLSGVLFLMDRYDVSRLPVVEANRLVGIITRKDVLRAESQALGVHATTGSRSYAIYQTRSAETGRGRVLVAVGNPKTAEPLVKTAAKFAAARNLDLECLHVITVPIQDIPSTSRISTQEGRDLLTRCEAVANSLGVPIHTSIRVARHVSDAVTETIADTNISVFMMRYMGGKRSKQSDYIIESILSRSSCSLVLYGRLFDQSQKVRCVLPVAELLESSLPREICVDYCDPASTIISLRDVLPGNSKIPNTAVSTNQPLLDVNQRFFSEKRYEVETSSITANSPAAVLKQHLNLTSDDLIVLGLPRTYLAKAINKGVFRKYLNRINSKCAIVITVQDSK